MKITAAFILVTAFLIFAGASILRSADEAAPDFSLTDLKGHEISLTDLKGKVVFLNFWATWCGPCRHEIPDFIAFYDEYEKKGAAIVGLSVDQSADKVKQFVSENKINYPVAMVTSQIMDNYRPGRFIPTTIIISPSGKIVDKKVGTMDKETLKNYFEELSKQGS